MIKPIKNHKNYMINRLTDGLAEARRQIDDLADRVDSSELRQISAHITGIFISLDMESGDSDD